MIDRYSVHNSYLSAPAEDLFEITPDDNNDLSDVTRALYIGVGGDLRITTFLGTTVTLTSVDAGWQPIRVKRVHSTGTTASDIIGVL